MTAWYNEPDPFAAQWLRNLIAAGHLPPGVVDERSILDVHPDELAEFDQCHFFAGIGVWPYALRRAGWPDNRPVWSGSCPCQPFSAAGRQLGFDDERHLWPAWFHLIAQRRPAVVVGEQVASALGWLDIVSNDLEAAGYAFGAADLCAAGYPVEGWHESPQHEWLLRAIRDCPDPVVAGQLLDFAAWAGGNLGAHDGDHIRQRLYFVGVADAERGTIRGEPRSGVGEAGAPARATQQRERGGDAPSVGISTSRLAADDDERCEIVGGVRVQRQSVHDADGRCGDSRLEHPERAAEPRQRLVGGPGVREQDPMRPAGTGVVDGLEPRAGNAGVLQGHAAAVGLADDGQQGRRQERTNSDGRGEGSGTAGLVERPGNSGAIAPSNAPDERRAAADWLFCRDVRWRPVRPGTFPLANAPAGRVGRLRAYGNALDGETVVAFVKTVMECVP